MKDFFEEALKDVPPVPFRAPPGAVLVRVNHKTGLPARRGDTNVVMDAFKPWQVPEGASGDVVEAADDGAEPGRVKRTFPSIRMPPRPAPARIPAAGGPPISAAAAGFRLSRWPAEQRPGFDIGHGRPLLES